MRSSLNFPIGGGKPANTCRRIRCCPDAYPLVVCVVLGNSHGPNDEIAKPGFATFITLFSVLPLLIPNVTVFTRDRERRSV